ncbi:MAG: hypothetical protein JSU80_09520 [Deltaproteobacteria bacterium]|nr:MAG: hypothetical protein JSU80_09520 [Deltaproteobacteria bacterium]
MNKMRFSGKIFKKRGGIFYLILSYLIVAVGCSTADLSSDKLKNPDIQPDLREKALTIFEKSLKARGGYNTYKSFNSVRLKGTDLWHSSLVRFFTPVTEQEQKFEVFFSTTGNEIKYLYLNGKRKGQYIGVENGKTYRVMNEEREFAESSKIKLYLKPLQDYFQWPYKLYESQVLLYAGETNIENEPYHLLFASSGGVEASPEHDQYLIYINKKTYYVDYIDFTLRSLFESYKGTLHYRDLRAVQGLTVPFFIGVSDEVANKDFVHEFLFSEIQFI